MTDAWCDESVSWTARGRWAGGLYAVDGVVYVGTDDGVTAFDAATGGRLWTHGPSRRMLAEPGERLLYCDSYGGVDAVDRVTGDVVWEWRGEPGMRAPIPTDRPNLSALPGRDLNTHFTRADLVVGGTLVCASSNAAAAFDADTGRLLWVRFCPGWDVRPGSTGPDGTVVFRPDNQHALALDPHTARLLWLRQGRFDVQELPGRRVLLVDDETPGPHTATLIDPHTGEPTVTLQAGWVWLWRLFGFVDGLVYAMVRGRLESGFGYSVAAFCVRTGEPVWLAGPDPVPVSCGFPSAHRGFGEVEGACATDEAVYACGGRKWGFRV